MKKTSKFLALLISVCLLLNTIPTYTFADELQETHITKDQEDRFFANGISIVVRKDEIGTQYIYDKDGTKLNVYDTAGEIIEDYCVLNTSSVFGGSDNADVDGDTSVTLDGAEIKQIYGGGKTGDVSGCSSVIIKGSTKITGGIWGGCYQGVCGSTYIKVNGENATLTKLYGGALGTSSSVSGNILIELENTTIATVAGGFSDDHSVGGNITIAANNCDITDLYGACLGESFNHTVSGNIQINLQEGTYKNIYGGGKSAGKLIVEGNVAISVAENTQIEQIYPLRCGFKETATAKLTVPDGFDLKKIIADDVTKVIVNGTVLDEPVEDEPSETVVTFDGEKRYFANGIPVVVKADGYIYDEDDNKLVVYNTDGSIYSDYCVKSTDSIFGGYDAADVDGDTKVTLDGATVNQIYGGGRNCAISGKSSVIVKSGSVNAVIGGSFGASVGSTHISISGADTTIGSYIAGGCYGSSAGGEVFGDIVMELSGVTIPKVNGGSLSNYSVNVDGNISITAENCTITTMYAGNNKGSIKGIVTVSLNGGTYTTIYGAGTQTSSTILKKVIFNINESAIIGTLYPMGNCGKTGTVVGGAVITLPADSISSYIDFTDLTKESSIIKADNTYYSRIYINGTQMGVRDGIVYATIAAPSTVTYDPNTNYVYLNGIPASIRLDKTDGNTYIYNLDGTEKLFGNPVDNSRVFGGSMNSVVDGNTKIIMMDGAVRYIYGGGYGGAVTGTAEVIIYNGFIQESIYGGGINNEEYIAVTSNVNLTVYNGSSKTISGLKNGIANNIQITLYNAKCQACYSGSNDTAYDSDTNIVNGNVSLTINGGYYKSICGGSAAGVVKGNSTIYINGGIMESNQYVYPLGKTEYGSNVEGISVVNVYKEFNTNLILNMDTENVTVNETNSPTLTNPVSPQYVQDKSAVLSTENDEGNLVFRFLDMQKDGESRGQTALRTKAGDCTVITFPNGQVMLVDAGSTWAADSIIADIKSLGITKLDYILVTHYHSDHVGDLPSIMDAFDVGKVLLPGYTMLSGASGNSYTYYTNVQTAILTQQIATENIIELYAGKTMKIGEGDQQVTLTVISPEEGLDSANIIAEDQINNASVVVRLDYKDTSALLAADIYDEQEQELIEKYPNLLDVDLLKIPHHAITSSSCTDFIRAVSPKIAVALNLQQNACNVLTTEEKYNYYGVNTYITGTYGMVKVTLDGQSASTATEWHESPSPIIEDEDEDEDEDDVAEVVPVTEGDTTTYTVESDNYGSEIANKALISNADINRAIREALAAAKEAGTHAKIEIKVESTEQAQEIQTSVPTESLARIAKKGVEELRIASGLASITFNNDALSGIVNQASSSSVRIIAGKADISTFSDKTKEAIGDANVYEFSIMDGTKAISNFGGGKATVTVPYTLKSGEKAEDIIVWYIGSEGSLQKVEGAYYDATTKTVIFETTHFSTYAVAHDTAESTSEATVPAESTGGEPIPDTGDNSGLVFVWAMLILTASAIIIKKSIKIKL